MELTNHMAGSAVLSLEQLSEWAGKLFCIQFVGVIIAVDCFRIMGLEWSDVFTGIIVYVPMALSFALLIPGIVRLKHEYGFYMLIWLILCLTILWFIVDNFYAINPYDQSEFDLKRPYFLLQGLTLAGLVGLFAVISWRSFALSFIRWTLGFSILAWGLYFSTYRLDAYAGRIGGATALEHAIVFTSGISCAFALLYFRAKGIYNSRLFTAPILWVAIVLLVVGILASGTRAALFGAVFSALIYAILISKQKKLRNVFILILAIVIIFPIAIQWVPAIAIERVTHIEVGGLNRRAQLTELAFTSFEKHPFGKTREYVQALDGVDYAHDTILQMLLEVGVIGAPILIIFTLLAMKGVYVYFRLEPLLSGFMIVLFNFILQSFSSGTGYDPQFWFSVLFLVGLTRRYVLGEDCRYSLGQKCG
jgi:O-Antigen ligase